MPAAANSKGPTENVEEELRPGFYLEQTGGVHFKTTDLVLDCKCFKGRKKCITISKLEAK
jgi:hypothetical protein